MRAFLFFILYTAYCCAYAEEWENTEKYHFKLVEVTNFSVDAALSHREKIPIVLLVSQAYCPFCIQIKNEILGPMILSGDYENRILIREIFIDRGSKVRDFNGQESDSNMFINRYNVDLTPTLLFLNPKGEEITERIVGIQTPELFYFYVDSAVQEAIKAYPGKN